MVASSQLEWIDARWHLDGKPIHAGCGMEVRWPDGTWQHVRIESGNHGHRLLACFDYHGLGMCVRVDDSCECELRWPTGAVAGFAEQAEARLNAFGNAQPRTRTLRGCCRFRPKSTRLGA